MMVVQKNISIYTKIQFMYLKILEKVSIFSKMKGIEWQNERILTKMPVYVSLD